MAASQSSGTELEARVQRLSLAQGVYAERNLFPAASDDHRMMATDIDVLTSEYHANFHVTRSNYECKGGKTKILDRVLWSVGVQTLLQADASYLVVPATDIEAVRFARALGVEILNLDDLHSLEVSLNVTEDLWPGRSNYQVFDDARTVWRDEYKAKDAAKVWETLRAANAFLDIDGWREVNYRNINRLLRLLTEVAEVSQSGLGDDVLLCSRYVISALVVRFSQYLLGICQDIAGIEPTEQGAYIRTKLIFGDNHPGHAQGLIRGTLKLVEESIRAMNVTPSLNVVPERLMTPPRYADDLIRLVAEIRASPNAARFLPLAMEINLFDDGSAHGVFDPIGHAVRQCEYLVGLIHGFVIRSLGVKSLILKPCCDDLRNRYGMP